MDVCEICSMKQSEDLINFSDGAIERFWGVLKKSCKTFPLFERSKCLLRPFTHSKCTELNCFRTVSFFSSEKIVKFGGSTEKKSLAMQTCTMFSGFCCVCSNVNNFGNYWLSLSGCHCIACVIPDWLGPCQEVAAAFFLFKKGTSI